MNLTPRDKRAIRLGAAALGAVFAVWLAGKAIGSWGQLRAEIDDARTQLVTAHHDAINRAAQQRRFARVFGPGATEKLPTVTEANRGFAHEVQKVAGASGVGVTSITPRPVSRPRDLPEVAVVAVQIRGTCELPALAKCLEQLRKSQRFMLVENLSVTKQQDGKTLSLTMTIFTLAMPEPKT